MCDYVIKNRVLQIFFFITFKVAYLFLFNYIFTRRDLRMPADYFTSLQQTTFFKWAGLISF